MAKIAFSAQLVAMGPGGAWTFLYLPKRASLELGSKGRVPILGRINGHPFRSSAFPTGDGTHQIAVNRAMQRGAGARPGDRVQIVLEVDRSPRSVRVPPDLRQALELRPDVGLRFAGLAPSHRQRYVEWIESAKRPETRARRLLETVRRVHAGIGAMD